MRTYHGEKAIISLTSWKARIDTVSKTLFSLITMCPGFHIVLVLSEEEFPKKEAELPASLMAFVNNNLIELLWVQQNIKSLKKIIFTMLKYPTVPIISADDDCIYKYNYAEELFSQWRKNTDQIVSFYGSPWNDVYVTGGYATLYPSGLWSRYEMLIKFILEHIKFIINYGDDPFYAALNHSIHHNSYHIIGKDIKQVCEIHNETNPLHDLYKGFDKYQILRTLSQTIQTSRRCLGV